MSWNFKNHNDWLSLVDNRIVYLFKFYNNLNLNFERVSFSCRCWHVLPVSPPSDILILENFYNDITFYYVTFWVVLTYNTFYYTYRSVKCRVIIFTWCKQNIDFPRINSNFSRSHYFILILSSFSRFIVSSMFLTNFFGLSLLSTGVQ